MDWIIVNATSQQMECLRCGKSEPLKLPALLQAFCDRAKVFIAAHAKCLALLGLFFACEAQAAEIPPFTLVVPSLERRLCDDDTTAAVADTDHVTLNVMARGSWSTLVKTFYDVPRDSAVRIALTTYPGAGGIYQVQWRASEPPKGNKPGVIGCWLPKIPVTMIAFGW